MTTEVQRAILTERARDKDYQRFCSMLDFEGAGCVLWTGAKNENGYGVFYHRRLGKNLLAHVYAYEQTCGPVPRGMELGHSCNVRHCVKPLDHVRPVTHADNVRHITRDGCRRGHPWHPDTTYVKPGSGERCCKICRRAYRRDQYHMRRQR